MDKKEYFSILINDRQVSFNIKRTVRDEKPSQRPAVLCCSVALAKRVIVPGVKVKAEKKLLQEIYRYQNQREMEKASFSLAPHLFSLLWRFAVSHNFVKKRIGNFL